MDQVQKSCPRWKEWSEWLRSDFLMIKVYKPNKILDISKKHKTVAN